MSNIANYTVVSPSKNLIRNQGMSANAPNIEQETFNKHHKKFTDSESDTESDSSSDEEDDTTDDDKQIAENPVLKERLKQLDRYANPVRHHARSPVSNGDQLPISNMYSTSVPADQNVNFSSLPIHVKCSGHSDLVENNSNISEYRSHQLSAVDSLTPRSGSGSINVTPTPKHSFSPSYAVVSTTGFPSNDLPTSTNPYSQLSRRIPGRSNDPSQYTYGVTPNNSDLQNMYAVDRNGEVCNSEFVCEICNTTYANRSSLQSHMKKHANVVSKRHQCDLCPYSTQYGKNLFKHIESMHMSDQGNQLKCEGCSRCFNSEALLHEHECYQSQCNIYRCNECGRVFKTKLRLKYHTDIHNPRKPYVCDVEGCDRAFRTPKYLKNHRDEFHRMQPKNYNCPVDGCVMIFHRKTHLKRHISTHDAAEKKYHCQWPNCQRRFCSEETLNLHYRKHTGEKPFSCALCLFSCYNKSALNEHYRVQHAKDSNIEGTYKNLDSELSPSMTYRQNSSSNFNLKSRLEQNPNPATRPSTPVPALRHRMADILESCSSQPPGPLDAEINGILDSLDKESELPDLFSTGNFDFDNSGMESKYQSIPQAQPSNLGQTSPYSNSVDSSGVNDSVNVPLQLQGDAQSSLSNTLPAILNELQQADLSGSSEKFENAKNNTLSVLPSFVTGDQLEREIELIVDDVLATITDQPLPVIRAMFYSTRPFTREEMYMVDSLEQQMMTDAPLTAPSPPRRRGRRPKMQQQLQPYLQRIFSLEPNTAEAMAAHLVNIAQYERNKSLYDCYRSNTNTTEFVAKPRGRGRGYRIRGRSGRPLSMTLTLMSDGSTRANHSDNSMYRIHTSGLRGGIGSRRARGGIRGRYRINRQSTVNATTPAMASSSSYPNSLENRTEIVHPVRQFDDPRCYADPHLNYTGNPACNPTRSEELDTSMQLRASRKLPSDFGDEDEIDDLEEGDDGEEEEDEENGDGDFDAVGDKYMTGTSCLLSEKNQVTETKEMGLCSTEPQHSQSYDSEKDVVNQDTLGEMLEDLGVIVKRIGERAAARKLPGFHNSSPYGQPINLSEFADNRQYTERSNQPVSHTSNLFKIHRTQSDPLTPPFQLPSMAALASASAGTPPSATDGSTPGCLSNADAQNMSPHCSNTPASQHPSSVPPPLVPVVPLPQSLHSASNQSHTPLSELNGSIADNNNVACSVSRGAHTTCSPMDYKSFQNGLQPSPPVWSCESMCCPSSRENASEKHDRVRQDVSFSPSSSHVAPAPLNDGYACDDGNDAAQCFRATDLSTRLMNYGTNSSHCSPVSPKPCNNASPTTMDMTNDKGLSMQPYPAHLSANAAAMGSLMSAVEAVDHLRSLSALNAKYTASLGMNDDNRRNSTHQNFRLPGYHNQDAVSPPPPLSQDGSTVHCETASQVAPATPSHQHQQPLSYMFGSPNMPSALNNLLNRGDRKTDGFLASPLGLASGNNGVAQCSPPLTGQTNVDPYSPYAQQQRCSSRGTERMDSGVNYSFVPNSSGASNSVSSIAISACSSVSSSSSSSARSYLQDLYQQRENQYHHHQQQQQHHQQHQHSHQQQSLQQQQQQSHPHHHRQQHSIKSPVHELTTRQLLSEAAATAYAHGLGRCDSHTFMGGLPLHSSGQHGNQLLNSSPRHNQYNHPLGPSFSNVPYRYHQSMDSGGYAHSGNPHTEAGEHSGFGSGHNLTGNEFVNHSNGSYNTGPNQAEMYHSLYPHHLRQASHAAAHHALARSIEQGQTHTAAHLVHSIHEASGLAAAEAAAAAAYAYHQYHQQQQTGRQQQHGSMPQASLGGAHSYYQNLLNPASRGYYPTHMEDQHLASREFPLHSAHTERRDPKSAYLSTESYRGSQAAAASRFLF